MILLRRLGNHFLLRIFSFSFKVVLSFRKLAVIGSVSVESTLKFDCNRVFGRLGSYRVELLI